ncbi:sensor histidine kinase [Seohaeicola nanhaiensis]|uniref:histidine kinase n=1 Tax=Seohaeicola nanhaiensis TaxID=1387282 RepID=A0ABV9KC13_9RHOB
MTGQMAQPITGDIGTGASPALALFRAANLAMILVDQRLTIRFSTPDAERLLGLSPSAAALPLRDALPGHARADLLDDLTAVMADGAPRIRELALNGGRLYEARLSASPAAEGLPAGCILVFVDITRMAEMHRNMERAHARLAESEARFRELLTKAPFAIAIHTGPDHVCVFANEEFQSWHPLSDPVGTTFLDRCFGHPNPITQSILDTAFRTGEAQVARKIPFQNARPDGTSQMRYFTGVAQPYARPDGEIAGVMTMTYEVTEEIHWREQQELLVSELRHRVKNLLAIVQAVASFSAINATDKDDLLARLQDRLEAIGRSNSNLITDEAEPRGLHDLVAQELAQLGPEMAARVTLTGADPLLPAQLASVIVLALHELTNNAVKHGAFSVPDGRLTLSCTHSPAAGRYRLLWEEHAPSLSLPADACDVTGFGLLLLTELITHEIGAAARFDLTPQGIRYELSFPDPSAAI